MAWAPSCLGSWLQNARSYHHPKEAATLAHLASPGGQTHISLAHRRRSFHGVMGHHQETARSGRATTPVSWCQELASFLIAELSVGVLVQTGKSLVLWLKRGVHQAAHAVMHLELLVASEHVCDISLVPLVRAAPLGGAVCPSHIFSQERGEVPMK